MTKIDIFSGFLGAGKTTLIKKLIEEAYVGEKLVLIENEFGEIGIDGGFLKDAGLEITEMNSGCICCSLVGDFGEALKKVLEQFAPDRILIEPSGVGKLSDVIKAVEDVDKDHIHLNGTAAVVDATRCKMYMKNFGEFFNNQIENAGAVILSRTGSMKEAKLQEAIDLIKEHNPKAAIITTDWKDLDGKTILEAIEGGHSLTLELEELAHEHDHHEHDENCTCGCHDHEHHHEHEHEHHHEHEHEHEHHHDHEHGHEHHHHHADEVFTSWGVETAKRFSREDIEGALKQLEDEAKFGIIVRAKGIVQAPDGSWLNFDYVPGESEIRSGSADVSGKLCVIGSQLNEAAVAQVFGL